VNSRSTPRLRKVTSSAKRKQIMIFAEGKETEPLYFTAWYRLHRDRIIVTVAQHQGDTTPMEIVERAITQRNQDRRDAKSGRGDAYDEYWCVFDVDQHPRLHEAMELAASEEIFVALSNPCIELWLIIHFQKHEAHISTKQAEKLAEKILGCGKSLTLVALERLIESYAVAKTHAEQLDKKHRGDGSPVNSNPSSGVWRLVDIIAAPAKEGTTRPTARDRGERRKPILRPSAVAVTNVSKARAGR
jgi:hypothetical protein